VYFKSEKLTFIKSITWISGIMFKY